MCVCVWNDPFTADGQGYGGGNVNADRALTMAKRATAAGLKVLVDFHYPISGPTPASSRCPRRGNPFEGDADKTADTVYDYTKQTLTTFKQAGVDVGMVQVGNENHCENRRHLRLGRHVQSILRRFQSHTRSAP